MLVLAIFLLWLAGSLRALVVVRGAMWGKGSRSYDVAESIRVMESRWYDGFDYC